MELREYIRPLEDEDLEAFALRVGTTVGHLRNVAYGTRVASAALARQIEIETGGQVPVSVTRPKDWHLIWDGCLNQVVNERAIVGQSGAAPNGAPAETVKLGEARHAS